MKKCCVIGLGYIGLPTAALIAKSNFLVHGVDIDQEVVKTINSGKVHFTEPQLEVLVKEVVKKNKLKASTKPDFSDVFIIAVPTPFKKNKSAIPEPNIEYVLSAAKSIAPYLREGNLVIIESTSPVGTTEKVNLLLKNSIKFKIDKLHICYCPERVIPGNIINELVANNRVVGGLKKEDGELAKSFYKTFCNGDVSITNSKTAELVKLTENTFRDINIAFANELSIICDHIDVNDRELIDLANQHPRVNILQPGCGVGGHCIAIDPWFLASILPKYTTLIQAGRKVNNYKVVWVANKIKEEVNYLKQKKNEETYVGCLGLSFKPNVDDVRESPAKLIVDELIKSGLNILVCEPNLKKIDGLDLYSLNEVIKKSDLIVFLVAHKEFKSLNLNKKPYIDFCGVLSCT